MDSNSACACLRLPGARAPGARAPALQYQADGVALVVTLANRSLAHNGSIGGGCPLPQRPSRKGLRVRPAYLGGPVPSSLGRERQRCSSRLRCPCKCCWRSLCMYGQVPTGGSGCCRRPCTGARTPRRLSHDQYFCSRPAFGRGQWLRPPRWASTAHAKWVRRMA